ncbi:DUF86 domain-containing protein [Candidatus Micrarchaeota archaeon]|nr:DUF86 domain-containing protein [Candidatus Micrarchaeota archaeon]
MSVKSKVYLEDILDCINNIQNYTKGQSYEDFEDNKMLVDAVLRNLEVIGEAVKKIPSDLKKKYSEVEWKKMAGLRDILIHEYFGIDLRIIWDIVVNKLPSLKTSIQKIIKENSSPF